MPPLAAHASLLRLDTARRDSRFLPPALAICERVLIADGATRTPDNDERLGS
jgi:hypothetical protein